MEHPLRGDQLCGLSDTVNIPEHHLRRHADDLSPENARLGEQPKHGIGHSKTQTQPPWGLLPLVFLSLLEIPIDFSEDVARREGFKHTF